jgi:hypothetical protein
VAYIGEKSGLGAIDLGQRLGTPAFLLVSAGIGDTGRDLPRQQSDKPSITFVVQQIRVEPGDEEPG